MRGVAYLICGIVLASLSIAFSPPAVAGEYYYSDGRYGGSNVWYSSDCCYRKFVRHSRSVHYERVYRSSGYYERDNYRGSSYYERPYYSNGYRSYSSYRTYEARPARYNGYDGYACTRRYKVRVADGRGGWVWAQAGGC